MEVGSHNLELHGPDQFFNSVTKSTDPLSSYKDKQRRPCKRYDVQFRESRIKSNILRVLDLVSAINIVDIVPQKVHGFLQFGNVRMAFVEFSCHVSQPTLDYRQLFILSYLLYLVFIRRVL